MMHPKTLSEPYDWAKDHDFKQGLEAIRPVKPVGQQPQRLSLFRRIWLSASSSW
ncbi:hypothetical protein KW801_01915 [Candidatus Saccharibacteria bacterium]|nr:hypothetical protein [Candidatus Saccharibacteria bacterium]